ncbi:MAG: 2-oxoacid:acceptor oxidoreductase subunit alpha [Phycisphaerales bacterium]|nr:2-oxoacid:acceptor oxidoreductase subunit alpha [Phycisphaerales bacterium]MCB9837169.1 2-oxoacid:acceptor oxidoreductase subunit alpha [Phycisphaera sp.]
MTTTAQPPAKTLDAVVIRFCGDSGDGMQLAGGEFTTTSAVFGNDIATFPDFPAEIRAPKGTTFGVSGFQLQFASHEVFTPGDRVNVLFAMNPAGFKTNIDDVEVGGLVIVNEDEFNEVNLRKCGYPVGYNPLNDDQVSSARQIVRVPMSRMTREALADTGLGAKDVDRCRNMFALGVAYWVYQRPLDATLRHIETEYGIKKGRPEIAEANSIVLKAGYHFGETAELLAVKYVVPPAKLRPGKYRRIDGNSATALGFAAAAQKASKQLVYASYPITPASDVLHAMARLKHLGIKTFQAEDEIAAVCAAIGASFAGDIGITGTSGPGVCLKSEAIGLAVMYELPLVVLDVQRAGPSTGMPTKTEQADLFLAMFGRAGESPCIVIAPNSPANCFDTAVEAVRLATRHMCPVIILSDASIANGAEPWLLPDYDAIDPIESHHPTEPKDPSVGYMPYQRDSETLARPWALPGTPGMEHRIGSLEKSEPAGAVSYDPANHEKMVRTRAEKVQRAAKWLPELAVEGDQAGEVLLLGWGSTHGAILTAAARLRASGLTVGCANLRYLNPMPTNLKDVLGRFTNVIVPENNTGQLAMLIRSRFLIDAVPLGKIQGRSFGVDELVAGVRAILNDRKEATK